MRTKEASVYAGSPVHCTTCACVMSNRVRKPAGGGEVVARWWRGGGEVVAGLTVSRASGCRKRAVRRNDNDNRFSLRKATRRDARRSPSHFLHLHHRLLRLSLNKDSPAFLVRISRDANRPSFSLISFQFLPLAQTVDCSGFLWIATV